ncbi:hypothetical protein B1L07_04430 [Stenotrophomonas acidaminiphila]|nr:hypothetical protein B1L07_04430 [Stenotrophomonas acidaminiphila]
MKKEIRAACAGAAVLVAMAGMQDAQAQRAPWWERQKAAQAAAQADGGETATQADAARPAIPQPASQAPLVRREKIEGPGYTWIEAGVARLDVDLYDAGEHGNGGYARGSVAVTDGLYVFGGYDRVSRDWNMGVQQLEVAIDQAEIGLGTSLSLSRAPISSANCRCCGWARGWTTATGTTRRTVSAAAITCMPAS